MNDLAKPMLFNQYEAPHADLREFLTRVDRAGELLRIPGADWNLEMGTLAELVNQGARNQAPAILFDDIPGYPKGFRVLSGATNSMRRLAISMGFPVPGHPLDVVQSYRDRMKTHEPIPPRVVKTGPVLENVLRDGEVDVLKFPVPFLHELDGGRYLGTDDIVIMRDPEENWVNCATYRVMVHDAKRLGIWISPGKQGRQIREKYFKQGKPCPVLVSCGHDPLLFLAGGNELRFGMSEYDYVGGHRGQPVEVIESELHGLPMPAHAELVIEGEMVPGEVAPEGPFGEFTGYYAGGRSDQPVIRVRRIYHRNDPILGMATPMRPPSDFSYSKCVMKAGMIWDEDIDPTDLFGVPWAMCTRCDPAEDIDIIRKMWSTPLDPRIPRGTTWNSRAVIDACKPYEMLCSYPPVAKATPALRKKVEEKFKALLARI